MKSPRILFAGLFHETHTFLGERTTWVDFAVLRGAEILGKAGDESPIDGFLGEAKRFGWEVIPTIDARATPSGTVEDAMFERYWSEFATAARPALASGVDAIYLILHGAMATGTIADVEGEFLARIRALPGAKDLPLFGVLDLHANVSARMCEHSNCLVMYRTNPHIDAKECAQRAAQFLDRALREKIMPRTYWGRPPMMWAPPGTGTSTEPMISLRGFAREIEQRDPDVWCCNVAAGFAFADTPDTGVSLSLISTGSRERAWEHLKRGAELAWSIREKGAVTYPPVDDVVRELKPDPRGPILLVEPADNIGGGAPGDCTGVLDSLLRHGVRNALVILNDPVAVAALAAVPLGGSAKLELGGKATSMGGAPVPLSVSLRSRSDGQFTLADAQSHLASMCGTHIDMGPCAVVEAAGITVLLTSKKTPPFDLGQLYSQQLDPKTFAVIAVKAAVAHRRAYDPIAAGTFYVDTPGPCSSRLEIFPFRHLRRPVWPLDDVRDGTPVLS